MVQTDQVIPAQNGYFLLRFVYLDRKVSVEFARSGMQALPTIAWRVVEGIVLPVALGDAQEQFDGCEAILTPSSMVCTIDGRSWKNVDAYAVDLAASWRAWRDARLKNSPPAAPPSGPSIAGIAARSGTSGFIVARHEKIEA